MRIGNNFTPSFCAKLLSTPAAGKIISPIKDCYSTERVSFVEIEPKNENDINALKYIAKYWVNDKYGKNIYLAADSMKNDNKCCKNNRVFALTSQDSNFEEFDGEKILGVVHVSPFEKGDLFIEHIQSKPYETQGCFGTVIHEYKGIGTAILNSLKILTNKIVCFPAPEKSVRDFYYKNGFIEFPPNSNCFIWQRNVFER